MANPNDNLYRLYQNGFKHFSLPDFDTFKQDMMDEQKRRRFYTNMQEAYSLPDFDTFSKDIGTVAPPPAAVHAVPDGPSQRPTEEDGRGFSATHGWYQEGQQLRRIHGRA